MEILLTKIKKIKAINLYLRRIINSKKIMIKMIKIKRMILLKKNFYFALIIEIKKKRKYSHTQKKIIIIIII
jgi:hypothetical protein